MTEKIFLMKGKAGLGNRLLAVLGGIVYCQLTGRRLVVDWRDRAYARPGENAFPRLFSSPDAGDPALHEGASSVHPHTWKGRLAKTVDQVMGEDYPDDVEADTNRETMRKYTADISRLDYDEDVLVRWAWSHELGYLRPRFARREPMLFVLPDNAILRRTVRAHLRPSTELQTRIDAFTSEHMQRPMIGLHVRYSDRKNPFEGYRVFVDRFLRDRPEGGVFLATDNQEVETYFGKLYPGRVRSAPKWMPPPGVPIHRVQMESRDPAESALEALLDMYLLGACDRLVVNTTSTFGHCAVLLSKATGKDIIDTVPFVRRIGMKLRQRSL
jgi:hypothetical protein